MSSHDEMTNQYIKRRKNIQEMMSKTSNRKIYVNKFREIGRLYHHFGQ